MDYQFFDCICQWKKKNASAFPIGFVKMVAIKKCEKLHDVKKPLEIVG